MAGSIGVVPRRGQLELVRSHGRRLRRRTVNPRVASADSDRRSSAAKWIIAFRNDLSDLIPRLVAQGSQWQWITQRRAESLTRPSMPPLLDRLPLWLPVACADLVHSNGEGSDQCLLPPGAAVTMNTTSRVAATTQRLPANRRIRSFIESPPLEAMSSRILALSPKPVQGCGGSRDPA